MRLHLPEQHTPTANSSPSNPRQLKKVLSTLPLANMGELTRQIFQILRDQNRQLMPSKNRLENLEMLRHQARNIFNNLEKYFINRTLPLPLKSQKIVNLNQSILRELINGYEIIVYEAANNSDTNIEDKTLSIAICRAINYLSETLLRSSDIYAPCPTNLWFEAHQLYAFAVSRKLTNNIIIDEEQSQEKISIENSYKQLLLFALAHPATLGQSDIERIFKKLYQWSEHTSIHHDDSENLINHAFHIKASEDSAPGHPDKNDFTDDATILILNADKLINHVKNIISQQSNQKQKIIIGDTIPVETLKALVSAWAKNTKRRFVRADHHGHINVAIGLKLATKTIRSSLKKNKKTDTKSGFLRTSTSTKQDPDFTLQAITADTDKHEQGYITHSENGDVKNDAWDMVAKGRVLTETYVAEKKRTDEAQIKLNQPTDSHWQIVNISAGGYCLHWDSDDTSKAQIGELTALQEYDAKKHFQWRIGIIRWMQFTRKEGLEIGIQVISPKVLTATVQRFHRPDETPFDCLMLPGLKALKQAPIILLPAHAFKTNDKLVVKMLGSKLNIT
ncbi:hypothetical protein JYT79_02960 [Cardiobacterium sp. AH-315-I02]|nr:hypothetical protein [Cardiobacterium sp. AH-315-I02]